MSQAESIRQSISLNPLQSNEISEALLQYEQLFQLTSSLIRKRKYKQAYIALDSFTNRVRSFGAIPSYFQKMIQHRIFYVLEKLARSQLLKHANRNDIEQIRQRMQEAFIVYESLLHSGESEDSIAKLLCMMVSLFILHYFIATLDGNTFLALKYLLSAKEVLSSTYTLNNSHVLEKDVYLSILLSNAYSDQGFFSRSSQILNDSIKSVTMLLRLRYFNNSVHTVGNQQTPPATDSKENSHSTNQTTTISNNKKNPSPESQTQKLRQFHRSVKLIIQYLYTFAFVHEILWDIERSLDALLLAQYIGSNILFDQQDDFNRYLKLIEREIEAKYQPAVSEQQEIEKLVCEEIQKDFTLNQRSIAHRDLKEILKSHPMSYDPEMYKRSQAKLFNSNQAILKPPLPTTTLQSNSTTQFKIRRRSNTIISENSHSNFAGISNATTNENSNSSALNTPHKSQQHSTKSKTTIGIKIRSKSTGQMMLRQPTSKILPSEITDTTLTQIKQQNQMDNPPTLLFGRTLDDTNFDTRHFKKQSNAAGAIDLEVHLSHLIYKSMQQQNGSASIDKVNRQCQERIARQEQEKKNTIFAQKMLKFKKKENLIIKKVPSSAISNASTYRHLIFPKAERSIKIENLRSSVQMSSVDFFDVNQPKKSDGFKEQTNLDSKPYLSLPTDDNQTQEIDKSNRLRSIVLKNKKIFPLPNVRRILRESRKAIQKQSKNKSFRQKIEEAEIANIPKDTPTEEDIEEKELKLAKLQFLKNKERLSLLVEDFETAYEKERQKKEHKRQRQASVDSIMAAPIQQQRSKKLEFQDSFKSIARSCNLLHAMRTGATQSSSSISNMIKFSKLKKLHEKIKSESNEEQSSP